MNIEYNVKRNSTKAIRVVCTILFCLFSFCYLFFFQTELMMMAQTVLSGGATHYVRLNGALIITAVLWIIQLGVFYFSKLSKRYYAVTYLPSFLLLTVLTSVDNNTPGSVGLRHWLWLTPLLLIACFWLVRLLGKMQAFEDATRDTGLLSGMMWENLMQMSVMMLMVCLIANGDDTLHRRMKMETYYSRGDYDGVLDVMSRTTRADAAMTMLCAAALSERRELPDRLFEFPVVGGGKALKPIGNSRKVVNIPDSIVAETIDRNGSDYLLCQLLMDRNLPEFIDQLTAHHLINAELPRYYREAVILFNDLYPDYSIKYVDDDYMARYKAFGGIMYQDIPEKKKMFESHRNFSDTYWWYYYSY